MRVTPVGDILRRLRVLAFPSASVLMLVGLLGSSVSAQVVTPFSVRFEINAPGAIDLIGNTLMTCPPSAPACGSARNGTAAGNGNNNNNYNMVQVDVDQEASTFNSSRAVLALPAGADVVWAGLYWGGDTSAGTGGTAAPNAAARTQVRFATPATTGYLTIDGVLLGSITTNLGTDYGVFADVTSLVLTLVKSASVDPVPAGGQLVYSLGHANVGASQATGEGAGPSPGERRRGDRPARIHARDGR